MAAYFRDTERHSKGGFLLHVKSAKLIAWFVASWVLLVFWAPTWWVAVLLTISLALSVAGIGFGIQHDGGHGAFGRIPLINRLAAATLDVTGGSSHYWRLKHGLLHHHYTNINGIDDDINSQPWLRMSPEQRRFWFHRFQHWYAWPLYGFLVPKWHMYDDFRSLITGFVGRQRVQRPRGWELVTFIWGKAVFLMWSLVIPISLGHNIFAIIGLYTLGSLVLGATLATIFQLAHCNDEALFPTVEAVPERAWAEHQLATTVDFAPKNALLSWYVGGLNFQVEHHLFPRISHVHYPKIAKIVKSVCEEYGVEHRTYDTLRAAIGGHVRHMRRMGRE